MKRSLLLGLCVVPLAFSLPSVGEPYGTSEDSLNAAIWGLGARNLVTDPLHASRGARVTPYPGTTGNGIYAHHPPLAVWLMVVPVLLGGWEGWPRLMALACAAATLCLLARVLRRSFEPRVAAAAVAAIAFSGFLLVHGKLLTTLTLATPLFLALLDVTLGALKGEPPPRWTPAVAALLVLSSWDGILGGAVLVTILVVRARAWPSAIAGAAALAFVAWHLIDATGGTSELRWQLAWRAGGSDFTVGQWLTRQGTNLMFGLGPLSLALLVVAPAGWAIARRDRAALLMFLLCVGPGLVMLLVFRQGAMRHPFWAFNLVLPAAVAIAMALTFAWRAALVCLVLQAGWSVSEAIDRAARDKASNEVGVLVARRFGPVADTVRMFTHYNFHPYVTWYARARPEWALTREALAARRWEPGADVLVDSLYTGRLGCSPFPSLDASADGRWVIAHAGELRAACATSSPRQPATPSRAP